jgi:ribosomal protein L39E
MTKHYNKKVKLASANKLTKWAPFWAVIKIYGAGKKVHPSQITAQRRHWRRVKLKIKPRRTPNKHLG